MKTQRPKTIKLLLVDDHPVVREGLKSALSSKARMKVVGEASTGEEAVLKARQLRPDIILLDINMPIMTGLQAAKILRGVAPRTKIIALTMHDNKEYILKITQLGARGYVLKDSSPSELVQAIETVHAGEVYFSSRASKQILKEYVKTADRSKSDPGPELSGREQEVLKMIATGLSNRAIAERMFVSIRTVQSYRDRIVQKLGINTVAGLTKYAIRRGLVAVE